VDVGMKTVEIMKKGEESILCTIPDKENIINKSWVESGKRQAKALSTSPKLVFQAMHKEISKDRAKRSEYP